MRRAHNLDGNHRQVVAALRAVGALVFDTSGVGDGFPDLVVAYRRRLFLVEIKDGSREPSRQRLTPAEEKFHALWADFAHVVRSVPEALALIGVKEARP